MRRYKYGSLSAIVGRQDAGDYSLSPASVVLCLSSLWELSVRDDWQHNGENLTDAEWDIVQNWISVGLGELMSPITCSSDEMSMAHLWDQKTAGTNAGSSVGNSFTRRDLTNKIDPDGIVTLTSNLFKPIAGTYKLFGLAPADTVRSNRLRLRNFTMSSTVADGPNGPGQSVNTIYIPEFTATGIHWYELLHFCKLTVANLGLGRALNANIPELYAQIWLWKTD